MVHPRDPIRWGMLESYISVSRLLFLLPDFREVKWMTLERDMRRVCRHDSSPVLKDPVLLKAAVSTGPWPLQRHPSSFHSGFHAAALPIRFSGTHSSLCNLNSLIWVHKSVSESLSEPRPPYFSFGSLITFSGHIWWLLMKKKKAIAWWKYKPPTLFPILLHFQCILVCTWGWRSRDFLLECLLGKLWWLMDHHVIEMRTRSYNSTEWALITAVWAQGSQVLVSLSYFY